MTISIDVEGDTQLIARLEKIGKQASPAMVDIANATAIELQGNIKRRIARGSRTGQIYTHYFATIGGRVVAVRPRAKPHQASAPGEAPKTDGGALVRSIYFNNAFGSFGAAVATVGSKVVYALYLEYGTRKIKPRPVWTPEAKKAQVKFIKRVQSYLDKVTQ